MYDHFLQLPLAGRPLHNALINGVASDQPIHHYSSRLSDPVAAIHGLKVTLGVLEGKGSVKDCMLLVFHAMLFNDQQALDHYKLAF